MEQGHACFLLVKSAPIPLIEGEFLEISDTHTSGRVTWIHLELNGSEGKPVGKIMILKETPQEESNFETD